MRRQPTQVTCSSKRSTTIWSAPLRHQHLPAPPPGASRRRRASDAMRYAIPLLALVVVTASVPAVALAQGRGAPQPPATPRSRAAFDLSGYWVSVVTEDWRWRMVTPP